MSGKRITVVIPGFNHADFVATAIDSVLAQDWPEITIDVIDDGSPDDTAGAAERALSGEQRRRWRVDRQENQGSARTLNRLIARADCDYVAILNSDDVYHAGRLRRLAAAAAGCTLFFGFTGLNFIQGGKTEDFDQFEDWYASRMKFSAQMPTCGFAMLTANIAVTSSNFFFSRELFDLIGGFDPALPLTQDWDFSVKALRWIEPTLIGERLLDYRVHPGNTWRRLQDIRTEQSRNVLKAYAQWATAASPNPLSPTPQAWPGFFPYFVRICPTIFSAAAVATELPAALQVLPVAGAAVIGRDRAAIERLVAAAKGPPDIDTPLTRQDGTTHLEAAAALWKAASATASSIP